MNKPMHVLLRRIWPLLASNMLLLVFAIMCMSMLSALRAFVAAESRWSKAQQDAVTHLVQFEHTSDLDEFKRFRASLAICLGERAARLELQKAHPDLPVVFEGLRAGGNNPDDIPGMIRLLRASAWLPFLSRTLESWAQGDLLIDELDLNGDLMLDELIPGRLDASGREPLLAEINRLDFAFRPLENEFSETLNAASRATTWFLEWSLVLSTGLFLGIGLLSSYTIRRRAARMDAALLSSEERVRTEQERALVTLASIYDGVVTTDVQGRIDFLNDVAVQIFGWTLAQARGLPLAEVLRLTVDGSTQPLNRALTRLSAGIDKAERIDGAILFNRSGSAVPVDCSIAPIRDGSLKPAGLVAVVRDVSRERELATRLLHQATHDELTGLANRREFERRVARALAAQNENGQPATLFYLDLDQFKIVNDTCGHPAGDALLRQVTDAIRAAVRGRDTLARLGGDEFGVLLEGCGREPALSIAETVRSNLAGLRFVWEARTFMVGASIGVVTIDETFTSVAELMSAADSACYLAKDAGRNRVQVYRPDDRAICSRSGEMNWVARITEALDQSDFVLFAQKIVPTLDPFLETSYEVLVRMVEPDGRMVPPMNFIPAAERYGLMPQVDRWVVQHTLGALGALQAQGRVMPRLVVNLSATSVMDSEMLGFISAELARHRIPADRLGFELTETAAVTHMLAASQQLAAIRALGCSIGLDDFGSGMSSFGYLRRLPIDYVKIDGSFVFNMDADPVDRAMVASIHKIVRVMGLHTVAERVENDAVLAVLREIGVDYAQGYNIARPAPLALVLQDCGMAHGASEPLANPAPGLARIAASAAGAATKEPDSAQPVQS